MSAGPAHVDDYVPGHGDRRYGVDHYDVTLAYRPLDNHLTGQAVLHAVVAEPTDRLVVDLHVLRVSTVCVAGAQLVRWTHRRGRLLLRLGAEAQMGTRLTVTVVYGGVPRPVRGPDGDVGWEELADGVIVASQPYGAPSWFPCNDRPADKATYRIAVTVPSAYRVVANGTLASAQVQTSRTTWVYEERHPMASYLTTVQIGRYVARTVPGSPVPLTLVHPPLLAPVVDAAFARQAQMITVFTRLFGPYPFDGYTVVVTADDLEIPLESQSLSTFGANHVGTGWEAERLVAHELSHQWFGNSLTLQRWRDIWLHEGFACYSEWLWSQESGGVTTADRAAVQWARLRRLPQDLVLGDPGPHAMFDDRVYKRGALLLHALRLTVGDESFFTLLRAWAAERRYQTVTTEAFLETANRHTGHDLSDLFRRWLRERALPAMPASALAGPARRPARPRAAPRTRHTPLR